MTIDTDTTTQNAQQRAEQPGHVPFLRSMAGVSNEVAVAGGPPACFSSSSSSSSAPTRCRCVCSASVSRPLTSMMSARGGGEDLELVH